MTGPGRDLAAAALRHPGRLPDLNGAGWDLLVRQARSGDLLARLAWQYRGHGLAGQVPTGAAAHFESALRLARAQSDEVERELAYIQIALQPLDVPIILLKGAAYLKAGLPPARGRLFSDVDILVPKARLPEVESALMLHGWATTHHSAYDQRYYRDWMHELPPLVHVRRQTALDVHHAIAPETARVRPDSARLQAAAVHLPGPGGFKVLAPADMVLHSMLHLLNNEEFSHGLRDLSDLDLLLRHFGAESGFWEGLHARASELGLGRTLHYGLRAVVRLLATPVPEPALETAGRAAPAAAIDRLMAALWSHGLRAPHRSTSSSATPWALTALYLRSHWVRMPPAMLARHLLVKSLKLHKTPAA